MKKIVILGTAYPFRGGLAAFNERLARELISLGHEVEVVTFTVQYPSLVFPGKSQLSEDPAPTLTIKRWVHSFNPINWLIAGKKIKAIHPDLIVCKYWLPIMGPCFGTVIRLAKNQNTEVVSIIDNIIPHEKRTGDRMFTRYFVKPIDRFIYMSYQVGQDLKLFNTDKPTCFIPHPIYDNYGSPVDKKTALTRLNLDPTFQYVLFFGFIRDYKGLDLLYEAIALLKEKQLRVKYIIAGEYYSNRSLYEKLVDQLDIADYLILHTHFISSEEVKYYFSACDLVVQPYKSATQSGIAQIAINFNKPTVVTKVGGLHEIIEDGKSGYVVLPEKNEIAKAIETFFKLPDHSSFEKEVEKVQIKYSWASMANAVLHFT
ncbi:MAG: glycosyltransferase [Saprospiraceae bacterium]